MKPVELSDDEIFAIPLDKRVKILQAQIDGARSELSDIYEKLEQEKLAEAETMYKLNDITSILSEEKKKLQIKIKSKEKLNAELVDLRNNAGKLEEKIRSLGLDVPSGATIKESEVEKLLSILEKEQNTVLKYQALIEKRSHELFSISKQCEGDIESLQLEIQANENEKKKMLHIISLEMKKLSILKQRNETIMNTIASISLDSHLTAVLESFANQ